MKKSSIWPAFLSICAWLALVIIPVSLAQSPPRPMFSLPSCSLSQQNNGQLHCLCANGDDLSFSFQQGELILHCGR